MADKSYKSYRQQLNILRSRGMVIGKGSQGSRVMRILERENYYNVINGYKELFLASKATATTEEVYKTGTTFDEVYALYNFDRELRNIYMKYLLKLENTFKTVISHEFSAKYGHDNYLKIDNFDNSTEHNISSSIKLQLQSNFISNRMNLQNLCICLLLPAINVPTMSVSLTLNLKKEFIQKA